MNCWNSVQYSYKLIILNYARRVTQPVQLFTLFVLVIIAAADGELMNRETYFAVAQCLPEKLFINISVPVAAPSSQRTIEDIEIDQHTVDGNSSSDDPLKSSSKR